MARCAETTNQLFLKTPPAMIRCDSHTHVILPTLFSTQLSCCRAVGQEHGPFTADPPGGNRHIPFAQTTKHFHLLASSHNPKYPASAVEHRISQRHPAPALVDAGKRYVSIGNIEYRIARHQ